MRAKVTGTAGENGQCAGNGAAARGRDRRLPGVVTHPRPWRALARSEEETREPGSGVAIDWVTGWSYSCGDGSMYSHACVRAR